MNLPSRTSRIDFDKIDAAQIGRLLTTGDINSLTEPEREYFRMMDMVRGLRARMLLPGGGKVVTKAGIIKLLKSNYGFTDWGARKLYDDAINFFYSECSITPRAWSNIYAEKLEKMADLAFATGRFKEGRSLMADAAKLRGCFDEAAPEIPEELLNPKTAVIYTSDAAALGAPKADESELEEFIDSLPDIPELVRDRVKEDAGIARRDFLKRMMDDVKEFAPESE